MIFRVVISDDPDTYAMRWLRGSPEDAVRGDVYFDTRIGVPLIFTGVAWLRMVTNTGGFVLRPGR